ncbi:hypothetical protein Tco_1269817, partial [Tanacetum coccineum]
HIDKYISVKIPDKDEDPELYQIVTDHMMHGPCGAERPSCPCTIGSIKYIFKYIYKGSDRVIVAAENEEVDEIIDYYDCRFSPVQRLPFHLPNEQSVIFNEHDSLDYTLDKASVNETKFQAWMETNKTDTFAQKLLYVEFSKYYVWKHDEMVWQRRQKGESIGCIHHVPPSWGDMFYFRVLLNKVRGTTDWEDFKKFDDVVYPTFKHACYARGLLEDDNEYIDGLMYHPEFVYEKTWHVMATDVESIERVKKNDPGPRLGSKVRFSFLGIGITCSIFLADEPEPEPELVEVHVAMNGWIEEDDLVGNPEGDQEEELDMDIDEDEEEEVDEGDWEEDDEWLMASVMPP